MRIPAVLDTACLIGLGRIGRLDLIPMLIEPVVVPPAVEMEFGRCPEWMLVEAPRDQGMVAALRLVVDYGEAEAITLAYEKRIRIILDDRKAREAATRLGIPVTGTVGLLVLAKQRGFLSAVLPVLNALEENHFRIGVDLKTEALRLAGE